jgi:hypothetical protein
LTTILTAALEHRKEGSAPLRPRGLVVGAGELGPDLAGVGVMQVVEDGQRLLPDLPGPRKVASCLVSVALGNLAEAAACYQRALSIAREIGDRFNEAEFLAHLARWCSAYPRLSQTV